MTWTSMTCKRCKGAQRTGIGGRLPCPDCGGVGNYRFVQEAGRWWIDFVFDGKDPKTGWVVRVAGNVRAPVESTPLSWRVVDGLLIGRGRDRYEEADAAREVAEGIVRELEAVVLEPAKSPKQCRFSFMSPRTG
jgi:hypothetical protein